MGKISQHLMLDEPENIVVTENTEKWQLFLKCGFWFENWVAAIRFGNAHNYLHCYDTLR